MSISRAGGNRWNPVDGVAARAIDTDNPSVPATSATTDAERNATDRPFTHAMTRLRVLPVPEPYRPAPLSWRAGTDWAISDDGTVALDGQPALFALMLGPHWP